MIKIFKATDTGFTSNGDIVLQPYSATITKNTEEDYIELEAPLKYADYLIQDNIIIVDTPAGKKGYRINNPVRGDKITIKSNLYYNETTVEPADRGAVIAYGKNLTDCTVTEIWDDVVTKLIPIGYNDIRLPEGYLSVTSPHQLDYEKTIEFELSESLTTAVAAAETNIETASNILESLKLSITSLQNTVTVITDTIADLQAQIVTIQVQIDALGTTKPELKEKAILEAQIDDINDQITSFTKSKTKTETTLSVAQADLPNKQTSLTTAQSNYSTLIINDLRTQAQAYLTDNTYPKINYDLESHLEGIVEIGDTVQIKHEKLNINMLAYVSEYQYNCLTSKFTNVQFGSKKVTFKGIISGLQSNIKVVSDGLKNATSQIEQLSDQIVLRVDANGHLALFKLSGDASSSLILLKADNINLEGLITANQGFKILLDGSFEAVAGKIAGFTVTPEDATTHDGGLIRKDGNKFVRISPFSSRNIDGTFNEDYSSIDMGIVNEDGTVDTTQHNRSDGYTRHGKESVTGEPSVRINDYLRYDQGVVGATNTFIKAKGFTVNRDGTVDGVEKAILSMVATKDADGNITSIAITFIDNKTETIAVARNVNGDITQIGDTTITYA